jgi:HD-GYP domain-containing protein (c-di-GMP phosphodiesterase class II)
MLARLRDGEMDHWIRHHHERLDGQGYPDRLPAEKSPWVHGSSPSPTRSRR